MLFLHEAPAGSLCARGTSPPEPHTATCALSTLAGESVASPAGSSTEQVLSQLSKMEISLTLTGKLVPVASSEESDTRSLLLR